MPVELIELFGPKLLAKQTDLPLAILDVRTGERRTVPTDAFQTPSAFIYLYERERFVTFRQAKVRGARVAEARGESAARARRGGAGGGDGLCSRAHRVLLRAGAPNPALSPVAGRGSSRRWQVAVWDFSGRLVTEFEDHTLWHTVRKRPPLLPQRWLFRPCQAAAAPRRATPPHPRRRGALYRPNRPRRRRRTAR